MSAATDLFIEDARAVSVAEAAERLGAMAGLKRAGIGEFAGPCPACGGVDRFSVNVSKQLWNCRGAEGGRDGIGLAAHLGGHDLKQREGLLAACADVLGRDPPDGAEETAEQRAAREKAIAARRAKAEAAAKTTAIEVNAYREAERAKARGKWRFGRPWGKAVAIYLLARLSGHLPPALALPLLRQIDLEPYWHGKDAAGRAAIIHEGPAMVAPFIGPVGIVIGCHLTWLDPAGPKGRPALLDEKGERLPTKKMRGSKKGGLIPLHGYVIEMFKIVPEPGRNRLVIGEAIENTLAAAVAEGFRADTLYAAAGDLGNLAGPADPASAFFHPVLKVTDKAGRTRRVRVQGPQPRADQGPQDAFQPPDQVDDILLAADGDSEPWMTAAAMERSRRRLAHPGRSVAIAWPHPETDFCDMLCGVDA